MTNTPVQQSFASEHCLGGLMVWAMDQKDQTQSNALGSAPNVTPEQQAIARQMSNDQAASLSCYTTVCNAKCKSGTNKVAQVFGQPGQISTRYSVLNSTVGETRIDVRNQEPMPEQAVSECMLQ